MDCSEMCVNSRPACALALCSLAEHTSTLRSCLPESDQVLSQSFHLRIDFPTLRRDFLNFVNYCISMRVQQNPASRPNGNSWRVCLFYFSPYSLLKFPSLMEMCFQVATGLLYFTFFSLLEYCITY